MEQALLTAAATTRCQSSAHVAIGTASPLGSTLHSPCDGGVSMRGPQRPLRDLPHTPALPKLGLTFNPPHATATPRPVAPGRPRREGPVKPGAQLGSRTACGDPAAPWGVTDKPSSRKSTQMRGFAVST